MNRYDYKFPEFSLDRAEVRYSADTAIKNCVIITDAKKPRISSIWGNEKLADLPIGNCRSAFTDSNGTTYFICGNRIYSTTNFKAFNDRGQIGTEQGSISWAESQSQNTAFVYLYFTDSVNLYRINILSPQTPNILINDYLPPVNGKAEIAVPRYLSYYQHRLLMTCVNSNQWFYSEVDPDTKGKDEMFNGGLNFYTTETKADKLHRIMATDMIYLFGERTTEVWQPTGNYQNPFVSNTATNFGVGTTQPQSIIDHQNNVYFVGTDNCLYILTSGRMHKISFGDLNFYFEGLITHAFPLQTNNNRFVVFKRQKADPILFNPANSTFTLIPALDNFLSSFWLDGEYNGLAGLTVASKQNQTALAYSGDALVREIKTPIVFPDSRVFINQFEFNYTINPLANPENPEDNQIFVSHSPNGGQTWSEPRTITVASNQGIIRLYGFGWAHNLQFKITCSNKQMLDIHRMTIFYDITMG